MKLVHFESGLGNQMLNYAEYLAVKKANPEDDCYIENIIYLIPEVNNVICQWNGYELDEIFSLNLPNIFDLLPKDAQRRVIRKVQESKFWEMKWNYPEAILSALGDEGYVFENMCVPRPGVEKKGIEKYTYRFFNETVLGSRIKLDLQRIFNDRFGYRKGVPERLFIESNENIYLGQTGLFMHQGNQIELIEKELRDNFKFPEFNIKKDKDLSEIICTTQSVSIHARRGDALGQAGRYYKTGYFRRAVAFIKKKIVSPLFVIFSDPGSMGWCRDNLKVFGLDNNDNIMFVDWHKDVDNYRDMQLMSMCKHNIITYSSFSWWASFLNDNMDKITISPMYTMNTTHHF